MLRRLSVASLLLAALACGLSQGPQEAADAPAANGTAGGVPRCCRASAAAAAGAARHPAAAAHSAAGRAAAHALLLPGPHLRLLRRHEDTGTQLRPHRVHEPHVRPVRVRAGGRRADGRGLSLPADHVREEPAATVHAGADPVRAVGGHVHAAVGRVHAGPQPARLPRHGGPPAAGAGARAALRLHGDGPRRRVARQAGRRGAARRRADGRGRGRWRRHLRRGHRGSQGGLTDYRRAGTVEGAAVPVQDQHSEPTRHPMAETGAHVERSTASEQRHVPLQTARLSSNFIINEKRQLPVPGNGGITDVLNGSLTNITNSPGKSVNGTQIPSAADGTKDHFNTGDNSLRNKSEGFMTLFLSHLRGAQDHSGSHVPPSNTVTNVIKNSTYTKMVFQQLAHVEHSNKTVTMSSQHPTPLNATKISAKVEEKTMTASKIYAQFEAHNSTVLEHSGTVHAVEFPPVQDFAVSPNKSLNYQKNSVAFAMFLPSDKSNNPFRIIFPLVHIRVDQSLKNPLLQNNPLEGTTPSLTCSQDSFDSATRIKCLQENGGSLSVAPKTSEIAHGNLQFGSHNRVKRSSDSSPAHIPATTASEPAPGEELHWPDESEMVRHSSKIKTFAPKYNEPDFPVENVGRTPDGAAARGRHMEAGLLPRDFRIQARQAWGSMLGIMWCAAGVLFSGPSFWNVMACLLQVGQAFIG